MRLLELRLSRNLANTRELPNVADALTQHDGFKVLLVGNSLTSRAVHGEKLASGFKAIGKANPRAFFLTPDGTNIVDWDYALRRYFLNRGAKPDLLLIGTGPSHLHDAPPDASRLGAYFVDDRDITQAWDEDLPTWEDRCEFMLGRASALHATRSRMKALIFGRLIPHYFAVEQWINLQRYAAAQISGDESTRVTYRHLTALLDLAQMEGVKTAVFSIPVPQAYETPPEVLEIIARHGARWLDLTDRTGLPTERFPDGYHLDAEGAGVFTARLVEASSCP